MKYFLNQYVIVRSNMSGVWFGFLSVVEKNGDFLLTDASRLWGWSDAQDVSEIAKNGVKTATVTAKTEVLLNEWIEIQAVSEIAKEKINKLR